ncbi:Uncharacterised protein [Mycobacteroides abscessus subsp. abscessus]|nr:Uncharacterised protein [Mycobacteroides abscessus subsp. abscessus]
MIRFTRYIISSFPWSNSFRTPLVFSPSMVSAKPMKTEKVMICSMFPSVNALIGFVGMIFSKVSDTGGASSAWNSAPVVSKVPTVPGWNI